ncbi:hypothetical protein B0A49_03506 [Cryomyces minteri]|uniref:Uncharacterized protein n=1 Tax=Cryomyces minteri TaxID=331657 RepID=A0A4U0XNV3_9PEZI|nr:hypothetical protein B0A49_03506 [Cryomyces minteri]
MSHLVKSLRLPFVSGCITINVDYRKGPVEQLPTALKNAEDALAAVLDKDRKSEAAKVLRGEIERRVAAQKNRLAGSSSIILDSERLFGSGFLAAQSEEWIEKMRPQGQERQLEVVRAEGMKHGWTQFPETLIRADEIREKRRVFRWALGFVTEGSQAR